MFSPQNIVQTGDMFYFSGQNAIETSLMIIYEFKIKGTVCNLHHLGAYSQQTYFDDVLTWCGIMGVVVFVASYRTPAEILFKDKLKYFKLIFSIGHVTLKSN